MISQGIASDYAVVHGGEYDFYYGYEFDRKDDEEVWGFRAKKQDKTIFEISYEEMAKLKDCPDEFECAECLLFGMAVMLERKTHD